MTQKSYLISFCLFLMLLFFSFNAHGSEEEGDFAGDETCMECHEEIYESFWENIHGVKG
ncbi:MAG: hypothetical protein IMF02_00975, partial [Proteobacteria bacterium]|nr:hypothetical protein [Pseudomonadota bacterium]